MFWRSTYGADENDLTSFDTKDTIDFSRYDYFGGSWSEAKEVYNGSLGSVKGMQAAMIHGGNAIVVFVLDPDPENDSSADCEIAYRVVYADNTMSDLVVLTNAAVTSAGVSLRNNSLQPLTSATLVASLLDENDQLLETVPTGISGTLNGETGQTVTVEFSQLCSRVVVYAAAPGEDLLIFEGLPVSIGDFTQGAEGNYTYSISGVTAEKTLITAISGDGEAVTINGEKVNSLSVPIGVDETAITVSIGSDTYVLNITSTHTCDFSGDFDAYDEHGHWHICDRPGCTKTDEPVPPQLRPLRLQQRCHLYQRRHRNCHL